MNFDTYMDLFTAEEVIMTPEEEYLDWLDLYCPIPTDLEVELEYLEFMKHNGGC